MSIVNGRQFIHRGRKLSILIGQFGDWGAIESRFPFLSLSELSAVRISVYRAALPNNQPSSTNVRHTKKSLKPPGDEGIGWSGAEPSRTGGQAVDDAIGCIVTVRASHTGANTLVDPRSC
jgi:hypothetical protein